MSILPTDWIDLDTAAQRSGKSTGQLRRVCKDKWQAMGLARKERNGARAEWFIKEEADAAFARVKFAEQIGTDLRQFPQVKRDEALRRLAILKDWQQAIKAGLQLRGFDKRKITGHFCERLLIDRNAKLSPRTLYNWEASYRADGLTGLVDGRGSKAAEKKNDPFIEEVKRLWLTPRQMKIQRCYDLASYKATEQGWAICSYKTCQRAIAAIPAGVVYKLRGGEEDYVNNAEPFLERDYTTLASNELWCSDHHQFDVLVRVNERLDRGSGEMRQVFKRPWLTAFQDLRSRKIVGWKVFAHDPNSDVILSVFREAVIEHGVPRGMLIDNGKDFDCKDFIGLTKRQRWQNRKVRVELDDRAPGLFAELGIDVTHAQKYHGQSKPIERWFGTVEGNTTVWKTYCGNSTTTKPSDLQLQLERGNAPTLEDFTTWFDAWVTHWNAGHQHNGQGMNGQTPDQVFAAQRTSIRTARRELLDVLCLKRATAKVHQNGVTWNGLRFGQYVTALQQLLDQEVTLRVDERDIGQVQVYTSDGRFVCIAPANEFIPANASSQDLRRAMATKRTDRKVRGDYLDRRMRLNDSLPDRMLRAAAAKAEAAKKDAPPPTGPPSLQPIRHPLESQLPALQTAIEGRSMRVAVGAESVSMAAFNYASPACAEETESGLDSPLDYLARTRGKLRDEDPR